MSKLLLVLLALVFTSFLAEGRTVLPIPSSFTGTTTAPGSDKTFEVSVRESGVGALSIPATGAVTVNGVVVTYAVTNDGTSKPTVTLTTAPAAGATVVVSGSTAGGNGSDYPATCAW